MFQLLRRAYQPSMTMLDIQMDANPVLDPNVVLEPEDIQAVTNHTLDCGLFAVNCNTENPYNNYGARAREAPPARPRRGAEGASACARRKAARTPERGARDGLHAHPARSTRLFIRSRG